MGRKEWECKMFPKECDCKMFPKVVRELVSFKGGPFRDNPEVYKRDRGMHGNLKHFFSVLITEKGGVLLFTYADSDEFLPVFVHLFNLKDISYTMSSPLGSSLLCLRNQELIVLSTEPPFKETTFTADGMICDAGFSPQENFLYLLRKPSPNEQRVKLEIRDAKTGHITKQFDTATTGFSWLIEPANFKWDNDDNYIASLESNCVVVIYETKKFSRIKPLSFREVLDFSWSPSAPVLAVIADSYIEIVDVCSGKELFKTGWRGADKCKLYWEGSGDYLACMCSWNDCKRVLLICWKSGKTKFVTPRGDFIDFAWRGNGKDFAVTQGTGNGEPTRVKFYTVNEDESNLRQRVATVEDMMAHYLHWSANGRYMVMQGPWDSGELYFYDVDNHQRLTSTIFKCYKIQWDSTSRFVLSQATLPKNEGDLVVRIWSSLGVKLIDVGPFFFRVVWGSKLTSIGGSSMHVDEKEDTSNKVDGDKATGKRLVDTSGDFPSNLRRKFDHVY